ncbi:uncharacterized protein LODBEIA_P30110 [Lodderomyces beijingensis]|uniref:Zn(2)-C6 fungal-type domain-containing protein n=1 Tax=Lodderomyces beijingensis TaxID=1775926 RepID=A0ABP0ZKV8_9ASCO
MNKFRVRKFVKTAGDTSGVHHLIDRDSSLPTEMTGMPTKITSCLRCRKLKKKCDKILPECSNCDKAGEPCQYVPRKKRKVRSSSGTETGSNSPRRYSFKESTDEKTGPNSPESLVMDQDHKSLDTNGVQVSFPYPHQDGGFSNSTPYAVSYRTYEQSNERMTQIPSQNGANADGGGGDNGDGDGDGDTDGNANANANVSTSYPRYHSSASPLLADPFPRHHEMMDASEEVENNDHQYKHQNGYSTSPFLNSIDARAPNFDAYPKQISKVLYGAVGIKTNSNVSIIPPITDKVLLTRVMNAFFMHTYRICPVINKSEFMYKFNKIFSADDVSGSLEEFDDQYELYMVLAIGSTHLERSRIIGRDKRISEYFVSMALSSVHNNISKNDVPSMRSLMLLALYSFFNPAEFISWEISGKLARMAIHLGLNQAIDSEAKKMTAREVEMRTRLLWSVYTIDRLTSVTLGRPVALNDDDINVPLPQILDDDEIDDITTYRLVIHLRQIEGRILRKVHSVNVHKRPEYRNRSEAEVCEQVLSELREEIEEWHKKANELDNLTTKPKQSLAFRASIPWFTARYNHLLILLYRPSYLNPQPSPDILDILGKACVHTLSSTYKLFKAKSLPLNWTTLYRFLMVGTTILHCLCKWAIDLMESKTEICYCIEIFEAFGSDWVVAKKCANVFKTIENKLLEITLTDGHTSDMDNLAKELLGASSSYHEILNVHSVDLCLDSQYMYGFES